MNKNPNIYDNKEEDNHHNLVQKSINEESKRWYKEYTFVGLKIRDNT